MYFICDFNQKTSPDFSSNSLVLPALTVGNVGQLAIDALVCTFKCGRVGFIDDPLVLPVVGNDPFTPAQSGFLTTKLEVFQMKENKVVFLQQRAPVMKGYASEFVSNLMAWVKQSAFKEIVLLFSADATRRNDKQLMQGSQFRYLTFPESFNAHRFSKLKWNVLENEMQQFIFKKGTVTEHLIKSCQQHQIPLVVFILFVSEGNNIPDGLQMGNHVIQYFNIENSSNETNWVLPPSWSTIINGPPVEHILFM